MKLPWISHNSDFRTKNSAQEPSIWFFGYGSLIWNPGMEYCESKTGRLEGYSRRFWQGNITYRGCPKLPGRVATIVEDQSDHTFGMLFKVTGITAITAALEHLKFREIDSGYEYRTVTVTCASKDSSFIQISALTCVATEANQWFLGPTDSDAEMARQIANARGKAGPNSDYLLNLAHYTRKLFPNAVDSHLFELERLVLEQLGEVEAA